MLRSQLPSLVILSLVVGAMVLSAQSPTPREQLHALFDRTWQWELSESPTTASTLGDLRWNDRWDDVGLAAFERRQAHRQAVLRELAGISRESLPPVDRTHYDVFKYQYATTVEAYAHRFHLIRTATYDGVQNTEQIVDNLRFTSVKDYEDWLARLDRFPAYVDQNIALLREGVRTNTVLPKVIVSKVLPQIAALATQPPSKSGYYKPFTTFPEGVTAADRTRLAAAGLEAVARARPAGLRLVARLSRGRVPARLPRPRRLVADQRRRRQLCLLRAAVHDDDADAARDPRGRPEGGGAHSRRDGSHQDAGGLQRDAGRVLHLPPDRPAVLLQDGPRAARGLSRDWPSASTPSS